MALDVPYRSVPDMFLKRVADSPDRHAFAHPAPDDSGPVWLTWEQVGQRAKAIAAGLHGLGVGLENPVAILANTRLDWVLADFGIMCAGGATTTVYPTTEPEDAVYIIADSGSKVLFAENQAQAAKIAGADLPALTHVVLFDGTPDPAAAVPQLTLAELEERGAAALSAEPDLIDMLVAGIGPDHLATLIYTSGTTGRPKGVELLHGGWCWEGVAQAELGLLRVDDLQYLWLPLSHSFGKTLLCGATHVGLPTYVDGRVDKLVELLGVVQPTLMCGAPRVFEKVYNKAVTTAQGAGGAKAKIFAWGVGVGKEKVALEQAGKPVPAGLRMKYALAEKLVFSKLQARLGGRMRVLVSGAAPLSKEIATFFAAANLPISEGYGLTETSAGAFVNPPDGLKIGSVGRAMGDLECRIDTDGEVLLRGKPVMRGYHNLPEETAAAFTEDGFFRTGDIGTLDADGYLRITDRKKDLVKTSGGKYVAPSHIEGMFKAVCPYTSQAVVIGQARNYCTMLVTLDPDAIKGWAAGTPLEGSDYTTIVTSPQAREMVEGYVAELNAKLNRWETIKKVTILPRDLTIEDGEVTPSLKIKRRSVETNFASEIDKMYEGTLAEL
ncbi:long-chain fatty acid--CoA ligase [Micromonospora aurantiaca]|uniref:Acyl-CoA synthetase n=3 Tax=Micromonospora aurantiaca (nom. illeg.) TaxID=47850 RepID=A0A3M9KF08_9ACTN|nr:MULTISPECIES: long-chain fatty acid--CoA ligase [Micromonospora]ADU09375.1 AMP-dependent synthetase and ligase [Micromonospora sp. L5]AXH94013.1 long-chain fatty acid--CoA ligase [Micromonospora aurantiaca]OHX06595.1 AMP-dependent synthetase [Micromonospora sp. WMMB235]RNH99513.1 long-chain fatty acid--CoA ligase [Micromonospora aurantiaca]UFN92971.1 long-chain fatty acid--CoA ligase [Micromonospora aurantiaca]